MKIGSISSLPSKNGAISRQLCYAIWLSEILISCVQTDSLWSHAQRQSFLHYLTSTPSILAPSWGIVFYRYVLLWMRLFNLAGRWGAVQHEELEKRTGSRCKFRFCGDLFFSTPSSATLVNRLTYCQLIALGNSAILQDRHRSRFLSCLWNSLPCISAYSFGGWRGMGISSLEVLCE